MKDKTKVRPKNVGKVAEILAEDPNATQREIAQKTELARNTVIKAEKELSQNGAKDPTITYIVGSAKDRIRRVSDIFDRYVEQIEEQPELKSKDIALAKDIVKDDLQRVTVFGGDVTDPNGGLKEVLTEKQQKALDALLDLYK